MKMPTIRGLTILLTAVCCTGPVRAAQIVWTNTAGGNWNVAANWSPNQVPTSTDDAVIAASGTYTVTLNTSPTIGSLTLGGASGQQTLTTAAYTLTLTNASAINANGVFNLNSGSLTATSPLTVHGLFNWFTATIMAGSVVTVAADGRMVLTSGSPHDLYGVITNAGTIQLLNGGGDLLLYDHAGTGLGNFINLPGALVDVQGDNSIDSSVGTDLVINQGTLRKSGGTGTTYIQPTFNNSGTLDVQTGTLNIYNSGMGTGTFLPEAGATLIFRNNYEVDSALAGAGTNLLNGGIFTLNGNITGSNVVLNGANLLASNTVINGALTWSSGSINAGSVVTVAASGLLTLTSGNAHTFYGILSNKGTILLSNGGNGLTLAGSCYPGAVGELVNLPGALVDVQGDGSISYGCGSELVINQGTLRKSGGTGTTTIYPVFTNSGTLDVQSGTVTLFNSGQGSGVYLPEAGATLIFRNNYELDSDLIGAGTNLLNGNTFTLNGNITGSNVVLNGASLLASNTVIKSALTWSSGSINAGSVVTVATNALLTLTSGGGHSFYGIMTNAGTIQLQNGGGDFQLYGSCQAAGAIGELINLPAALVDLQGDNSIRFACNTTELIINRGVLRKSGGTGTSAINPAFNNSGTVQANSGTMSFSQAFTQSAGQTMLAGGDFIFSQVAQFVGGSLTGTGTITGSISNNATIGTGASPGVLTIVGNYTEGLNAHLGIKLGGISAGTNYDQLSVSGTAALAGALDLSYWNGFTPSAGNVFTVLAGGSRSGAFSAVTFPASQLTAIYTAKTVLVEPANAPPTAKLTVPAQVLAGHAFAVKGSGTDVDGTVTNLTLFFGTNVLVSAPGSSAQASFSSDFPGNLTLTAVATDNEGAQGTTNAIVNITTLPRLTLDSIGFQTNGSFKLLMFGDAGSNYQVLASTNLALTNWTLLGTMESTNGIWRYFDTTASNFPRRFYRAR